MNINLLKESYTLENLEIISYSKLSSNEIKMILEWRNDENIRIWSFNQNIISLDDHLKFLNNLKNDYSKGYWLIKHNTTAYIGVFNLSQFNLENKTATLGNDLNPKLLGKGFGQNIMRCIEYIGFEKLQLSQLDLEVLNTNIRAIKFYKKMNFIETKKIINDQNIKLICMSKQNIL